MIYKLYIGNRKLRKMLALPPYCYNSFHKNHTLKKLHTLPRSLIVQQKVKDATGACS
jgi:hypothetical protein